MGETRILTRGHVKIGEGMHSVVYRRPGSRWVLQAFKADTPLTPRTVAREYAYLTAVFAAMPGLVPAQRLFAPGPDAPAGQMVVVKQFVDVDRTRRLTTVDPARLASRTRAQIARFLGIVRQLVDDAGKTAAPDIIDPPLQNLAVDTDANLRLLDTNRLISTAGLARLHRAGRTIDLDRDRIYALLLRRLMFLESRFLGRSRADLAADGLYTRYLTPGDLDVLVAASAAVGEPIRP